MFGILAAEALLGLGASLGAGIAAIGAGIGIGKSRCFSNGSNRTPTGISR